MPRGFLVKRNKRTGPVSYRIREEDSLGETSLPLGSASYASCCMEKIKKPAATQPLVCNRQLENIQSPIQEISKDFHTSSVSLTPAVSQEHLQKHLLANCFDRTLKSSFLFQAESFSEPHLGNFNISKSPAKFSKSSAEMTAKLGSQGSAPALSPVKQPTLLNVEAKLVNPNRQKLSGVLPSGKLLNCWDKVAPETILRLQVKEEDLLEDSKQQPKSSMLGEFICQLCKERYSDPLTLAQHQCSRIARVEYRCAECDKVFNCPANLASHRRWHKPKEVLPDTVSQRGKKTEPSMLPVNIRNGTAPPSKQMDPPSVEEITFNCRFCGKKFRRRSYLRKHLALHNRNAAGSQQNQPSAVENKARPNCNIPKHGSPNSPGPFNLRWESSQVSISDNTEMCLCRYCGDSFFSSPGLMRHISKCHPTETKGITFLPQRALEDSVALIKNQQQMTSETQYTVKGCVLSPLLFTLLTHDSVAMHSSNHIIKFTDDTTVVGLISKNDERAWSDRSPPNIDSSSVEIVKTTKFLGVHRAENFTWSLKTSSIAKKAQQLL
ncbi:insulinoma-associated protein 1a-like [Scleropages formosus]|uniref:insulinoma-associated protein 1a-like n=1 Tax=Scleropages formosus TaxID=113540 RepID=UPI000878A72E|nr:insulinoma-associated protein 1a-like [Scleropages formosus]